MQEGEFQEVLAHCLAEPGVHVIELPIDYSTSAQLQVRTISARLQIDHTLAALYRTPHVAWHAMCTFPISAAKP